MFAPLLLALAVSAQAKPAVPIKAAPALPALSSSVFQDLAVAVEISLQKGDFAEAQRLAASLPKAQIALAYEDAKVPESSRLPFRDAMERAARDWRAARVLFRPKGEISVRFTNTLAPDPETGVPGNVAIFLSDRPGEPRVEAVIALHRGSPLRDTTPTDVANDVRYAVGVYLGVGRHQIPQLAMSNAAAGGEDTRMVGSSEMRASLGNLRLANALRDAVTQKTRLTPSGRPKAEITVTPFEGSAVQGETLELDIPIANRGAGPLSVAAEGDCGCVVPDSIAPIPPGGSTKLHVRIETRDYQAPIERRVILFTNDASIRPQIFPIKIALSPRFRFVSPEGNAFTVDKAGKKFDVYLYFPEGRELPVRSARMLPIDGAKVTFEPWSGSLADPERGESERPRKGYLFHVEMQAKNLPGRSPLTLSAYTGQSDMPELSHTVYIQQGIVPMPEELFLGELPAKPKTATVVLSQPNRPFVVRSAKIDSPYFTVKVEPGKKPDETKLVVTYNGKGFGDLGASIVVLTDDPKQPKITIPVVASAR